MIVATAIVRMPTGKFAGMLAVIMLTAMMMKGGVRVVGGPAAPF